MTELLDGVYYARSNDDPNPSKPRYWKYSTGRFHEQHTIHFGGDMAGVANPIVDTFSTWPVCRLKRVPWA